MVCFGKKNLYKLILLLFYTGDPAYTYIMLYTYCVLCKEPHLIKIKLLKKQCIEKLFGFLGFSLMAPVTIYNAYSHGYPVSRLDY